MLAVQIAPHGDDKVFQDTKTDLHTGRISGVRGRTQLSFIIYDGDEIREEEKSCDKS